jgi:putative salt-induced outer membrane protein
MIDAAIARGDGKAIETVFELARQTHGYAGAEINEIARRWRLRSAEADAQKQQQRMARLEQASLLENWEGQMEVGASRSTGRHSYVRVLGSLGLDERGSAGGTSSRRGSNCRTGEMPQTSSVSSSPGNPTTRSRTDYTATASPSSSAIRCRASTRAILRARHWLHPDALGRCEGRARERARSSPHRPGHRPDTSTVAARASLNLSWAISPTLELKQAGPSTSRRRTETQLSSPLSTRGCSGPWRLASPMTLAMRHASERVEAHSTR